MRLLPRIGRLGVLTTALAGGMLCVATPAMAGVTVTPGTAPQGAGANLTFRVANDQPNQDITGVRLVLPADTPVAEAYPLSHPDWAPRITNRTLNPPVPSLHGGPPVSEATAVISWAAIPGRAIKPGGTADLTIAIGPLPETDRMPFTVQLTYAGGAAGPPLPPVVLQLAPDAAAPHAADEAAPAADGGTGWAASGWAASGWIVALVMALLGLGGMLARRRRDAGDADRDAAAATPADSTTGATAATEQSTGAGTPAAAQSAPTDDDRDRAHQARVTTWSYRDDP